MSYKKCPSCGGMNRQADTSCYQCEGDLAVMEAEATSAEVVVDYAKSSDERKSDWAHGVRAGLVGGVVLGLIRGVLGISFTNSFARAILGALFGVKLLFLWIMIECIIYCTYWA